MGRRVLKFDGAFGPEGGGIALSGDEFYNAAFGGHVHIECHNQDYHRPHRLRWMACHWIRGSLLSPMNPVPLPPQGETRKYVVLDIVSHMTHKANPVTFLRPL